MTVEALRRTTLRIIIYFLICIAILSILFQFNSGMFLLIHSPCCCLKIRHIFIVPILSTRRISVQKPSVPPIISTSTMKITSSELHQKELRKKIIVASYTKNAHETTTTISVSLQTVPPIHVEVAFKTKTVQISHDSHENTEILLSSLPLSLIPVTLATETRATQTSRETSSASQIKNESKHITQLSNPGFRLSSNLQNGIYFRAVYKHNS